LYKTVRAGAQKMTFKPLEENTEFASALLKSLANEKRLLIVCLLSQGEKNVGDLEKQVGLSQSALSQHLARLRRDGVVDTRREAQTIFYTIKNPAVHKLLDCLNVIYGPVC
jgi:DNA-binding transcriptional ArsR family regulator